MKTENTKARILLAFLMSGVLQTAVGQVPLSNNTTSDEIVAVRAQIETAAKDNDRTSLWYTAEKIDVIALKLKNNAGTDSEKSFQQLLQMLQAIDAAQAVNFDPKDWPALNTPPVGKSGRLYDSGISPEAIKDPDDRRAYEIAIVNMAAKAKQFSFQLALLKMKNSMLKNVEEFRSANIGFSERDKATLRSAVDKTITRKALRSQLEQSLSLEKKP